MHTQRMFDLVRANEEAPGFDLRHWFSDGVPHAGRSCGTVGCLAGNYELRLRRAGDSMYGPGQHPPYCDYGTVARHFGITTAESYFLFSPWNLARWRYGIYYGERAGILAATPRFGMITPHERIKGVVSEERDCEDRQAAIGRVRKFIYYKLHKREMLYDADGRVRETIRRAEGDHRVDLKVRESCRQLATA